MKKLGKEMVGYCGCLPLAITVLGGLLAAKQTHKEWEDVLRDVKSHKEDFRASEVLALSYNDLPSHLKPCFLYLAHFPEDFEIPTRELISMWLGEGFISRNQHVGDSEDTMENEGERYLRELVQRYMVQVGNIGSFGRIKTCRMHDLMRDFCISKAQAENFLQIASMEGNGGHIGKLRRLAINSKSGDNSLKVIKFNKYPYLRSLLYFLPYWDHYRHFNKSSENALYFKESCFNVITLLRVLNMENFGFYCGKLPKDIRYLIHLRFLSLRKSNMTSVPSSMGNLRCLETLDLRSSVRLVEVPNVFKKMEELRHLYLPIQYRVSKKLELANLSYLQTLVNVEPKTIQIPSGFLLNRLRLRVWTFDTQPRDAIQKLVSSYPHTYNLYLFADIRKLPEAHQLPQNLAKLTLRRCYLEEDPMSTLEKLPNLKILCIRLHAFVGKSIICCGRGFPLLQSLILEYLPLEDLRVEEGAMPSLCQLKINLCTSLEMIPDGLRFITTLEELEIRNMPKSFKDRLDRGGPDFYKVQHVPSCVFQNCDGK